MRQLEAVQWATRETSCTAILELRFFPRGETGVCHRRRRHTPVKMDSDPSLCASKGKVVILCPTGLDDNPRQEIHYCSFSLASTTYCRRHRPNSRSLLNGEGAAGVRYRWVKAIRVRTLRPTVHHLRTRRPSASV
jgi:hypothetical protein